MKFMAGEDSKKPLIKAFLLVPFQSLSKFFQGPHVILRVAKKNRAPNPSHCGPIPVDWLGSGVRTKA